MCFERTSSMASGAQFLISPVDKEQKREKEEKYELVDYDSLPEYLKHNEFIVNYYRSEWPLKQTVLSIFSIHNETLNIWTHLIGFLVFLALTGYALSIFQFGVGGEPFVGSTIVGNSSSTFVPLQSLLGIGYRSVNFDVIPTELHPASRWPFYMYLVGAMFCLLMSSGCHLLSCHSAKASYVMLRLDFAGISGLIVSSFYPLVYYPFACQPFFRDLYLSSITVFGVAVVVVSLLPIFDSPQFRPVRAVLFAFMGASGIVPIAHKLMAFGHRPEAVLTTVYEAAMLAFYGFGVVVYAMRVPERWMPGRFDLAGHSHQLFHVLVVAGAYTHYLAILVYLGWREAEGC